MCFDTASVTQRNQVTIVASLKCMQAKGVSRSARDFDPKNKASAAAEAPSKLEPLLLGFGGLRCCGLAGVGLRVLPAEALNASGGVHQFLLAGKERVAIRADFQVNGALVGGPGGKCVSACAVHAHFFILGMDRCLHCL
jgi:hypothetical protein